MISTVGYGGMVLIKRWVSLWGDLFTINFCISVVN